jgi:DNA-binding transcriptional ArsR family regulator
MISSVRIAEIATAIADPARVNMLMSLVADGEITSGDLALAANIAPSTASEHLARMTAAGVLAQRKDGRARIYRIADPSLYEVLEGIVGLASRLHPAEPLPPVMLHTRLCYDHLAGRFACDLTAAMFDRQHLKHTRDGVTLTRDGAAWFGAKGVDVAALLTAPRMAANLCKDWTDDGYHLGGGLGSALLKLFRQQNWVRTRRGSPKVEVTPIGRSAFLSEFGIDPREAVSC